MKRLLALPVIALALAGCSSASTGHPQPTAKVSSVSVPAVTTTAPAVNALAVWCGLTIGESKKAVLAAMGAPHGMLAATYIAAGTGGDFAEWDGAGGDILLATFANGAAVNLQAYGSILGQDPASNLSCPGFRN